MDDHAGELVIITPLFLWSEANREAAELHIATGKLYAVAIGESQPSAKQVAEVRARAKRFIAALGKAERMEVGASPQPITPELEA